MQNELVGMMDCPECGGKAEVIEWSAKTTAECMNVECDFRADGRMAR